MSSRKLKPIAPKPPVSLVTPVQTLPKDELQQRAALVNHAAIAHALQNLPQPTVHPVNTAANKIADVNASQNEPASTASHIAFMNNLRPVAPKPCVVAEQSINVKPDSFCGNQVRMQEQIHQNALNVPTASNSVSSTLSKSDNRNVSRAPGTRTLGSTTEAPLPTIQSCYSLQSLSLIEMMRRFDNTLSRPSVFKTGSHMFMQEQLLYMCMRKHNIARIQDDISAEFFKDLVSEPYITQNDVLSLKSDLKQALQCQTPELGKRMVEDREHQQTLIGNKSCEEDVSKDNSGTDIPLEKCRLCGELLSIFSIASHLKSNHSMEALNSAMCNQWLVDSHRRLQNHLQILKQAAKDINKISNSTSAVHGKDTAKTANITDTMNGKQLQTETYADVNSAEAEMIRKAFTLKKHQPQECSVPSITDTMHGGQTKMEGSNRQCHSGTPPISTDSVRLQQSSAHVQEALPVTVMKSGDAVNTREDQMKQCQPINMCQEMGRERSNLKSVEAFPKEIIIKQEPGVDCPVEIPHSGNHGDPHDVHHGESMPCSENSPHESVKSGTFGDAQLQINNELPEQMSYREIKVEVNSQEDMQQNENNTLASLPVTVQEEQRKSQTVAEKSQTSNNISGPVPQQDINTSECTSMNISKQTDALTSGAKPNLPAYATLILTPEEHKVMCHLVRYMRLFHNNICFICYRKIASKQSMWGHILDEHVEWHNHLEDPSVNPLAMEKSGYPYFCSHCMKTTMRFPSLDHLLRHEWVVHLGEFSCYICGCTILVHKDLVDHLINAHCRLSNCFKCHNRFPVTQKTCSKCDNTNSPLVKLYACPICGTFSTARSDLVKHFNKTGCWKTDAPQNGNDCYSCKNVFRDKAALEFHQSPNANNPALAPKCPFSFKNMSSRTLKKNPTDPKRSLYINVQGMSRRSFAACGKQFVYSQVDLFSKLNLAGLPFNECRKIVKMLVVYILRNNTNFTLPADLSEMNERQRNSLKLFSRTTCFNEMLIDMGLAPLPMDDEVKALKHQLQSGYFYNFGELCFSPPWTFEGDMLIMLNSSNAPNALSNGAKCIKETRKNLNQEKSKNEVNFSSSVSDVASQSLKDTINNDSVKTTVASVKMDEKEHYLIQGGKVVKFDNQRMTEGQMGGSASIHQDSECPVVQPEASTSSVSSNFGLGNQVSASSVPCVVSGNACYSGNDRRKRIVEKYRKRIQRKNAMVAKKVSDQKSMFSRKCRRKMKNDPIILMSARFSDENNCLKAETTDGDVGTSSCSGKQSSKSQNNASKTVSDMPSTESKQRKISKLKRKTESDNYYLKPKYYRNTFSCRKSLRERRVTRRYVYEDIEDDIEDDIAENAYETKFAGDPVVSLDKSVCGNINVTNAQNVELDMKGALNDGMVSVSEEYVNNVHQELSSGTDFSMAVDWNITGTSTVQLKPYDKFLLISPIKHEVPAEIDAQEQKEKIFKQSQEKLEQILKLQRNQIKNYDTTESTQSKDIEKSMMPRNRSEGDKSSTETGNGQSKSLNNPTSAGANLHEVSITLSACNTSFDSNGSISEDTDAYSEESIVNGCFPAVKIQSSYVLIERNAVAEKLAKEMKNKQCDMRTVSISSAKPFQMKYKTRFSSRQASSLIESAPRLKALSSKSHDLSASMETGEGEAVEVDIYASKNEISLSNDSESSVDGPDMKSNYYKDSDWTLSDESGIERHVKRTRSATLRKTRTKNISAYKEQTRDKQSRIEKRKLRRRMISKPHKRTTRHKNSEQEMDMMDGGNDAHRHTNDKYLKLSKSVHKRKPDMTRECKDVSSTSCEEDKTGKNDMKMSSSTFPSLKSVTNIRRSRHLWNERKDRFRRLRNNQLCGKITESPIKLHVSDVNSGQEQGRVSAHSECCETNVDESQSGAIYSGHVSIKAEPECHTMVDHPENNTCTLKSDGTRSHELDENIQKSNEACNSFNSSNRNNNSSLSDQDPSVVRREDINGTIKCEMTSDLENSPLSALSKMESVAIPADNKFLQSSASTAVNLPVQNILNSSYTGAVNIVRYPLVLEPITKGSTKKSYLQALAKRPQVICSSGTISVPLEMKGLHAPVMQNSSIYSRPVSNHQSLKTNMVSSTSVSSVFQGGKMVSPMPKKRGTPRKMFSPITSSFVTVASSSCSVAQMPALHHSPLVHVSSSSAVKQSGASVVLSCQQKQQVVPPVQSQPQKTVKKRQTQQNSLRTPPLQQGSVQQLVACNLQNVLLAPSRNQTIQQQNLQPQTVLIQPVLSKGLTLPTAQPSQKAIPRHQTAFQNTQVSPIQMMSTAVQCQSQLPQTAILGPQTFVVPQMNKPTVQSIPQPLILPPSAIKKEPEDVQSIPQQGASSTTFSQPMSFVPLQVLFQQAQTMLTSQTQQPKPNKPQTPAPVQLTAPVSQLTAPVSQMAAPVSQLTAPVSQLTAPVSQLTAPVSQLTAPVPQLTSSVPQLAGQVPQLAAQVPQMASPVPQLAAQTSQLIYMPNVVGLGGTLLSGIGQGGTFFVQGPQGGPVVTSKSA